MILSVFDDETCLLPKERILQESLSYSMKTFVSDFGTILEKPANFVPFN